MSQSSRRRDPQGSAGAVLRAAREFRQAETAAATGLLEAALDWAVMHEPVDPGDGSEAMWWESGRGFSIAGAGTPQVTEFAVCELAAALGMSTEAGRSLVGQALDLAFRLPNTWDLMRAGKVQPWKARRFAELTRSLPQLAAAFVDDQLAAVLGRVSWAQLDRLIAEARVRFEPQTVDDPGELTPAPDRRGVWVHTAQAAVDGLVPVEATLRIGDALDLEQALQAGSEQLRLLGSTDSLHARRAGALGEMARRELTLTFPETVDDDATRSDGVGDVGPAGPLPQAPGAAVGLVRRPRQTVTLYLHLHQDALRREVGAVGRCENTRSPVTAEAVRAWCGDANVSLTVKPVIDLTDHHEVEQYEIPDRLRERLWLRAPACVFPWCTHRARNHCDGDHVIPYDHDDPAAGGSTCDCNLAPLCRKHHRAKTHGRWRTKMLEPGVHLWHSPHGYVFVRDHNGTTDVTPPDTRAVPACRAFEPPALDDSDHPD
ncbi:MAG: DUF222 domain-containing protein [Nocardioidaceae bacterium]